MVPGFAINCKSFVSEKDELVHPCHNWHSLNDRNFTSATGEGRIDKVFEVFLWNPMVGLNKIGSHYYL